MAQLTENQIYTAFGFEPPSADNGAQVQDPAAPVVGSDTAGTETTNGGDGVQVQDPAAPAAASANSGGGTDPEPGAGSVVPEDPDSEADDGAETEPNKPLTTEQRRQNAARRRQEEQQRQQQAIDSAVQKALADQQQKQDAAMADFFAKAGMKNSITGKPITNMDEFNTWQNQFAMSRAEQNLKNGKLTPEDMQQLISQNPVVQQAQQVIERSQEAERQAQQAQARARIDAEIAEVGKLAESYNLGFKVESMEDLVNMPNSKAFYDLIRQKKSIPEAFKLAFFDQMMEGKARAAQQTAMVNSRGKDHLTGVGNTRGAGMVSVPAAEMEMYRRLLPGASDAEIQAHYNRYKKNN